LLNKELQNNIKQLNFEIEKRRNAQLEREKVFEELEKEIRDKSEQEIVSIIKLNFTDAVKIDSLSALNNIDNLVFLEH